jgi:photosystem II stability/assembly factor-like uncharacterized protein/putative cell wall-binding protein
MKRSRLSWALCTVVCVMGVVPLSVFAAVRPSAGVSQTWSWQNPLPQGNYLRSVDFTDADTGWAVGDGGTILRTTDGGVTWTKATSGTTRGLRSVRFTDEHTGWAVGDSGTIIATSDGGVTWTKRTSGTTQDLHSVHFTDADTGWAVGGVLDTISTPPSRVVLKTSDGGTTWTTQVSGEQSPLNSVDFVDGSTGWAVGGSGVILHTKNGGSTWTTQTSGTGNMLFSVDFIDGGTGWAVGDSGVILHTANGGATWTSQASGTTGWLESVHFVDANKGWAVGGEGTMTGTVFRGAGEILHTANGGATWTAQTSGTACWLASVHFDDASTGWTVGEAGTSLKTTNGGATWSQRTSRITDGFSSVSFTDPDNGWAVGEAGTILATADGGSKWTTQTSGTTDLLDSVSFVDGNHGWAVGGNPYFGPGGTILHTSNGGTTWTMQTSGTGNMLSSVCFTDANTGWAVGASGTALHTANGGSTWTPLDSSTLDDLECVRFIDANTGWAVGGHDAGSGGQTAAGVIMHTTDGGTTWARQTWSFVPRLSSVDFVNATTGWAVGEEGTILATTDGGSTWTAQTSGTTDWLSSVDFVNATTGWSAGGAGTILKTTNGGATWTPQTSGTANGFGSVHLIDANTGWAVGGGGTILKMTTVDSHVYDSVSGAGRYDTAVQASMRAFPTSGSADTIVLATGANWPDALGGSALAGAYGGPLLLTKPDVLSQQVIDEALRINISNVVILGSEAAVSGDVETQLKGLSVNGHGLTVTRVGGAGRYDTAARIASATVGVLASKGKSFDNTVYFATGKNFPDALAASPIAAAKARPILLVAGDMPGTFTEDAIASLPASTGIILGSDRAVSTAAEAQLTSLLATAPVRLAGATRYDTGIAVAAYGVAQGLSWDGVAIATGGNFPDALAGGVMQGKLGSVLLLTPGTTLNTAVATTLTANKASINTVRYLGSTKALSQGVRNAVATALR